MSLSFKNQSLSRSLLLETPFTELRHKMSSQSIHITWVSISSQWEQWINVVVAVVGRPAHPGGAGHLHRALRAVAQGQDHAAGPPQRPHADGIQGLQQHSQEDLQGWTCRRILSKHFNSCPVLSFTHLISFCLFVFSLVCSCLQSTHSFHFIVWSVD